MLGEQRGASYHLNPRAAEGYRERRFARVRAIDRYVDMNITRRLRGFIGMGMTWGVCFSALSITQLLIWRLASRIPLEILGSRMVAMVALRGFAVGFTAGALFALALTVAERRRTLSALSSRRIALWGFLGTAVLPVAFTALFSPGVFSTIPVGIMATSSLLSGLTGSAIATMILRVARRAPAQAIEGGKHAELSHVESGDSK